MRRARVGARLQGTRETTRVRATPHAIAAERGRASAQAERAALACRSEFGVGYCTARFECTRSPWAAGSEAGSWPCAVVIRSTVSCRAAAPTPSRSSRAVSSAASGFVLRGPPNAAMWARRAAGEQAEAKGGSKKTWSAPSRGAAERCFGPAARFGQLRVEMFWIWRPVATRSCT